VFPQARKDRLTVQELPEETLVYDHERHKAHCLNASAALVWRHCDGNTSVDELARLVAQQLQITAPAALVGLALEQLERRHLLDCAPPLPTPGARVDRRKALKKLALAAATLPIIMTIATKTAAQSMSGGTTDPPPPPPPPSSTSTSLNLGATFLLAGGSGGAGGQSKSPPPPPSPCRTKGQSCVALGPNQGGNCCSGLTCTGLSQGAGVCG
jgi:Coenzyme PQQ synthesis protein D (PqqD)